MYLLIIDSLTLFTVLKYLSISKILIQQQNTLMFGAPILKVWEIIEIFLIRIDYNIVGIYKNV